MVESGDTVHENYPTGIVGTGSGRQLLIWLPVIHAIGQYEPNDLLLINRIRKK